MIYRNMKSRKKEYAGRIGLKYFLWVLVLSLITVGMHFLLDLPLKTMIIFLASFLFYFVYLFFLLLKAYDTNTFEMSEDKICLHLKSYDVIINKKDIIKIAKYPTMLDKNQIIISANNRRAMGLQSYIDGYDEILQELNKIMPIEQNKTKLRRALDIIPTVLILAGLLNIYVKNLSLAIILAGIGILGSLIDLIRYIITNMNIRRKIISIVLVSTCIISFSIMISINSRLRKSKDYRKLLDGTVVLMDLLYSAKYDDNNNMVYYKSEGFEEVYKYDENGNQIFRSNSNDYEEVREYNSDNMCIKSSDNDGSSVLYEYDENNNLIYYRENNDDGSIFEEYNSYDENNLEVYSKNVYKDEEKENITEVFYKYDDRNNCIYSKRLNGQKVIEYYKEYDKDNNLIRSKEALTGSETVYTRNSEGKPILVEYITDASNFKISYQYDEKGNLLIEKNEDGTGTEYSYDYDKNGNILKKFEYTY